MIFAVCLWGFSLIGSFQWNVTISAMARLIYYGTVCAALPVLRRSPMAGRRIPSAYGKCVCRARRGGVSAAVPPTGQARGWVLGILAALVIANSVWAARRAELTSPLLTILASPVLDFPPEGGSMPKTVSCRDVGADCDFVARGDSEAEVLRQVTEHARTDHKMSEIPTEVRDKVGAAIRDEAA